MRFPAATRSLVALIPLCLFTGACSNDSSSQTPIDMGAPGDMTLGPCEFAAATAAPTKLDVLFVVEDGAGSGFEQSYLASAIPDLLSALLNPACVDANGNPVAAAMQPAPTGDCPTGTTRDFPPILDAHVGVLSASLGTYGANGCPDSNSIACPNGAVDTSTNDRGHLITRADPCAAAMVPTYMNLGFLVWNPTMSLNPPGLRTLSDLSSSLSNLILGAGQIGCGFAAQNEAWYRFLVDPNPYQSISLMDQDAMPMGTDQALLAQRAAFLRPDSLLLIVNVAHKTDGSIKHYSFYPLFAQLTQNGVPFHLPRARSECASKGPLDPCCASCGQSPPPG